MSSNLVLNRASNPRQLITVNAVLGEHVHRVHQDGKNWIVAPVASLRSQVLPGSQGSLFYPIPDIVNSVPQWDYKPLTNGHPFDPQTGQPLSASDPGVIERQGMGHIRSTQWSNNALRHEAWFDADRTRQLAPDVYNALLKGKPVAVSTGLFTRNIPVPQGTTHNGTPYHATARNYTPDHLAVLQNERGACHIDEGCGVNVTNVDPKEGCGDSGDS